jgi:hypothetical protein
MADGVLSPDWRSLKPKACDCGHIGEATVPEGSAGRAPSLHHTLEFALQLRKNHGKTAVRVSEGA